jgi:hypothetical protein
MFISYTCFFSEEDANSTLSTALRQDFSSVQNQLLTAMPLRAMFNLLDSWIDHSRVSFAATGTSLELVMIVAEARCPAGSFLQHVCVELLQNGKRIP